MVSRARPGSSRVLAASGLCALLLGAACGQDPAGGAPAATQTPASPTATTGTPSVAPSVTPSATATATPVAPGLRGLLPSAAQLPGFNAGWKWREVRTRPADTQPFGSCARFDVLSLGAEKAVVRSFAPAPSVATPGVSAEAMAVRFPDTATAARVQSVLTSWHADCAKRLRATGGFDDLVVRPVTRVPTTGAAQGSWYLLSWTGNQGEDGFFHAFGLASGGKRMVLLTMDNPGQDHNYPPGREPMAKAVALAAAALG